MIKKRWFSDLEIPEICQKTNSESKQQDPNTLNIEKQEESNRNELQSDKNQNTKHLKHTEQEINVENLKRIISEKKTTLPSLRNID